MLQWSEGASVRRRAGGGENEDSEGERVVRQASRLERLAVFWRVHFDSARRGGSAGATTGSTKPGSTTADQDGAGRHAEDFGGCENRQRAGYGARQAWKNYFEPDQRGFCGGGRWPSADGELLCAREGLAIAVGIASGYEFEPAAGVGGRAEREL